MRVLIAGGGTGGHLYPGIALAREILSRDPEANVSFVGTAAGIEARVVPLEGFSLDLMRVAGVKGRSLLERIRAVGLLPLSAIDAWRVVSRRRPEVVVGVGGYASGPVLVLAALRGLPTMVLEQNALPGLTNRLLARVVRAAAVTFEETLRFFPGAGFVAGNPVRPEFVSAGVRSRHDGVDSPPSAVRVLIFGGSQGAHAINLAMVAAAPRLAAAGVDLAITHQTGQRDVDLVRRAYEQAGLAARVEAFLDQMASEMNQADLIVCRAGATTIAELTTSARAAILVPLPTAADDHQRKNAAVLARAGAADVIEQRDAAVDGLADALLALARDPVRRARMSAAARGLARPDAAARIADRLWELAGKR
ncbi:MAG: undecaprenyldiphospho-muramoylpentapeptide beta-N-acetylglucosaminyltransferase [Vicinamibacterales bacterium]